MAPDDGKRSLNTDIAKSAPVGSANKQTRRKHQEQPSLLDHQRPFFSGIQRFGVNKKRIFFSDPFHTLLNLPWWKFIIIFFLVYIIQFMVFAFLYWAQPKGCISGLNGKFSHALWFSSRVASTIGFNAIVPKSDCPTPNLTVMLQVICSSLIDFVMLGIVFARFSAPFKRVHTVGFTEHAVVHRHTSGYWCVEFKVANLRKHQILKPEIRMMLTAIDSITPSNYAFDYLDIEDADKQQTNLQLGLIGNVVHVVRPHSPLWQISLQEMATRMMEVLVFVDGIDAMTSKQMQARKAYAADDIRMNEEFLSMHLEMRGGRLGLDFSQFGKTASATEDLLSVYSANPNMKSMDMPEVRQRMSHLRHLTFRRLTEQQDSNNVANTANSTSQSSLQSAKSNPFAKTLPVSKDDSAMGQASSTTRDAKAPSDQGIFTAMPL